MKLSRTLTHSQQGVAELAMSSCTMRLSGIIIITIHVYLPQDNY